MYPIRLILPFRTNLHKAEELAFEYAVTPPFLKKSIVLYIDLTCNTFLLVQIYRSECWVTIGMVNCKDYISVSFSKRNYHVCIVHILEESHSLNRRLGSVGLG